MLSLRSHTPDITELLRDDPGHWDRLIASDLAQEVRQVAGDVAGDLPAMRRFLAVKGFRALKAYLEEAAAGMEGEAALRAAMHGMRAFAKVHPGLSAATFRNRLSECTEWRDAGEALAAWLGARLAEAGIPHAELPHALRTLRAFIRGFVIHEMQGSFLDPEDHDGSFAYGVEAVLRGLTRT